MDWVKLSTSYDTDAAIMRAGEAAEVLFTRSLAYCGREETGGFIPDGIPERLAPKSTKGRVAALVRERLWSRDDARRGWQIRSWESWQSELDALAERRRADRERKRRERERRAEEARMSRDRHVTDHVTDSVTERSQREQLTNTTYSTFSPASRTPDAPSPAQRDFVSRDCPSDSPARDREERVRGKNKTPTDGPYASLGRTARDAEPPDSDGQPSMVEQIMTEYRENSPRGVSRSLAAKLAQHVYELLADDFHPDHIREGLGQLRPRKLGPGALPSLVDEIANRLPANVVNLPGPGVGTPMRANHAASRPSTTDQRVAAALAAGAALQAELDRKALGS